MNADVLLRGIDMTLKRNSALFYLVFWTISLSANLTGAVVGIDKLPNGTIKFEARDASLEEIVKQLFDNLKIEVRGLEDRADEKVSFSHTAETTEDLLKNLLRRLGIRNYAFEFAEARLNRLVVVPEAANDVSVSSKSTKNSNGPPELVSVARIQSIVEGSQAESAGLQQGDLILEYDGERISSARQLVREVEKKSSNTQIELLVVRQNIATRLVLNGGFMGVRVTTQKIPRNEVTDFQTLE